MSTSLKTLDGTPISRFAFGTMQFGGKADEAASAAMYRACRDAGINCFDTAWGYADGRSETFLGRFVAPERERVFIATKCAYRAPGDAAMIRAQTEESLRRLGTDVIDLLYLHHWHDETPLEESLAELAKLVGEGKVRHIGVSNFAGWQTMKADCIAKGLGLRIAAHQPMYNLVKRQAEVEILPMAISEGIAVFSYSPLGGGLLTGKYARGERGRIDRDRMYAVRYGQEWMRDAAARLDEIGHEVGVSPATLAVAWVARHPGITAPIISGRTAEQLAPSLAALDFEMPDALYARLCALSPTPAPATDRTEEAQPVSPAPA